MIDLSLLLGRDTSQCMELTLNHLETSLIIGLTCGECLLGLTPSRFTSLAQTVRRHHRVVRGLGYRSSSGGSWCRRCSYGGLRCRGSKRCRWCRSRRLRIDGEKRIGHVSTLPFWYRRASSSEEWSLSNVKGRSIEQFVHHERLGRTSALVGLFVPTWNNVCGGGIGV